MQLLAAGRMEVAALRRRGHWMNMSITIEQIREFLHENRHNELGKPGLKKAAVLMLLYPRAGGLHVLLTKRTEDVEHHKGQISFPGGSRDEQDNHSVATALRESEEEIGLPPGSVEVLGILHEYETPSGFAITPVVAYAVTLPRLKPNAREVAEILEVPLSLFLDNDHARAEKTTRFGREVVVYFYRYGEYEIWGATAAIMRSFVQSVVSSTSE